MLRGAGIALATHAALVGLLLLLAGPVRVRVMEGGEPPVDLWFDSLALPESLEEPWSSMITAPAEPPAMTLPPPDPARLDFPRADATNEDARPAAATRGLAAQAALLAPDSGEGPGRTLPLAWRRDSSTLRSHLSDGSPYNQPSREKLARRASSPQAERMERKVGEGDSARTEVPQATAPAPPDPALPAEAETEVPARPVAEANTPASLATGETRGEGPLDVELGRKAFDVTSEGPARDAVAARAASDETSPGLTDYTAVAARGPDPGNTGKGVSDAPGVLTTRSAGTAPVAAGWPEPRPAIGEIGEGSLERLYAREHLEIRRRVARVLRFPKRLALMLEQGEAIVQFIVERDGRVLGAVKLLNSAGFDEFDKEALDVVRRAAPFPLLSRPLLVTMRIPFENPLVR